MPCPARLWAWWLRRLLKIIINNVYAFQYPTKNRCTILVQPSFAKLVLLPIREAYEWKPNLKAIASSPNLTLASNSRSVWMETSKKLCRMYWHILSCFQFVKRMNGNVFDGKKSKNNCSRACFQFVKRMNGNASPQILFRGQNYIILLPIREAYEWKPQLCRWCLPGKGLSCFQFVKRMNGNIN